MWDSATWKVYAKFVEIRCSKNDHFSHTLRKISAFCKEKVTYIFCSLTPIKSKKIHPNSSVNDIQWASCNVYGLHLAIQRYSFIRLIRITILFDEIKLITGLQIFTQIRIFDNIIKYVTWIGNCFSYCITTKCYRKHYTLDILCTFSTYRKLHSLLIVILKVTVLRRIMSTVNDTRRTIYKEI